MRNLVVTIPMHLFSPHNMEILCDFLPNVENVIQLNKI
jgi:hypothetical protein